MKTWNVIYRIESQGGKPIGGGIANIVGRTVAEAEANAASQLRARYEVPRGRVTFDGHQEGGFTVTYYGHQEGGHA